MKISFYIDEVDKEKVLNLLKNYKIDFETDKDFEVPHWQMEETISRMKEIENNTDSLLTLNQLKEKINTQHFK